MKAAAPWSYTGLKSFLTCPKQFYHERVLQEYPFRKTPETEYGNEFHLAADKFIRLGTPLPKKFRFMQKSLDQLAAMPGEKYAEQKLAINGDLKPCSYFAKDVWYRGIVDFMCIDGTEAKIIDYKTGKSSRYADVGQLELMTLLVLHNYPQVKTVKCGLMFVIAEDMVKKTYKKADGLLLWRKWMADHAKLEAAFKSGTWNPKPSGLCKNHCPVTECVHNGNA